MEVQIVCSKMIKPSAPTPPHLRILKLSPVDQVQYSIKTAILFYYSGTRTEDVDVESRNERLQASLSETLTRFYPLAGRYVEEGNWVDCNDEGAEYLEAKVKGEVLRFRDHEMIADHQVHLAGGAHTSPTFSVQINMFDCGGLVISTRFCHNLFDGISASSFLTSWATASRHSVDDVVWPFFELSSILPAKNLPLMKPLPPPLATGNIAARRFVLDRTKILALKARARDPSFQREPTRVEVVTALIWRALMGVSRAKHGHLRSSLAYHSMNLRPRIVPPLPPVSCANLHSRVISRFSAAANADSELPELKDLMGILINTFSKSKQTAVAREDVYSTLLRTRNETHEAVEKGEVDAFMFTSWCGFPFYQLDLGWGKPVWVSRLHSPCPATCLVDTPDAQGIEAWVTLDKQDMPRFLQDDLILAITSKQASCASLINLQHPTTGISTTSRL